MVCETVSVISKRQNLYAKVCVVYECILTFFPTEKNLSFHQILIGYITQKKNLGQ